MILTNDEYKKERKDKKPVVEKLAGGRIPVEVIDMRLYGIMDGKSILTNTLEKIK